MLRLLLCAAMALWSGALSAESCPYGRATYVDRDRPASEIFVVERAERRRVSDGPAWVVLIGRLGGAPSAAFAPYGDNSFYFVSNPDNRMQYPFMGDVTHEPAPSGFFEPPVRSTPSTDAANFRLRCRSTE